MARAQQLIGSMGANPGAILRSGRQRQQRTATPLRSPNTSTGNATTQPMLQRPAGQGAAPLAPGKSGAGVQRIGATMVNRARPLPSVSGDKQINSQIPTNVSQGASPMGTHLVRPTQPTQPRMSNQIPVNIPQSAGPPPLTPAQTPATEADVPPPAIPQGAGGPIAGGPGFGFKPGQTLAGVQDRANEMAASGGLNEKLAATSAAQQEKHGPTLGGRLPAQAIPSGVPTAVAGGSTITNTQTPIPAGQTQAGGGGAPIGLENLAGVIERGLGTPSAFGSEQIDALRSSLRDDLGAQFQEGVEGLDIDAARRGVFHSTVPTAGRARLQGQQDRALASADAGFAAQAAQAQDAGRRDMIGAALNFGQMGQQGQQFQDNLAARLAEISGRGAPSGDVAATNLAGLGGQFSQPGAGQIDPSVMALIAQMFGGGGGR